MDFRQCPAKTLTEDLLAWPGWALFDPTHTLLLLPGRGAMIVRAFLPTCWLNQWHWEMVPVKRIWYPGSDPFVIGGSLDNRIRLGIHDVIILDDVISSGVTCQRVRRANSVWIPGARWSAMTWIMQRAAKLSGFHSHYASRLCGTNTQKASINSLSTLLENKEIAECFARRRVDQPAAFLALLEGLRQIQVGK